MNEKNVDLGRTRVLYRVDEAAALLSVSRSRVYELIRSGQLETVTVGKSRRVPSVALDGFVRRLLQVSGRDDAA